MLRFVTTLVLTVVGLIGATIWWGSREGSGPWPPSTASVPAVEAVVLAEPAPAPPAEAAPEAAREPRAAPEPGRAAPPAPAPAPVPTARALPPVPAPTFAEPPAPAERTLDLPVMQEGSSDEAVEETLVHAPAEFVEAEAGTTAEAAAPEVEAEGVSTGPAGEERAVALSPPPARSADLIRRLLGIYESLGSRR